MTGSGEQIRTRGLRGLAVLATVLAGGSAGWLVGVAAARSFTLEVAKKATVNNQSGSSKTESIVVNSKAFAVYMLSGDSKTHPECTKANGCFSFWPPVTVRSAKSLSKAPGVPGKLGTWRRNGFIQVTLNGHPLYTYALDVQARVAKGQGVKSFGGTWYVIKAKTSSTW